MYELIKLKGEKASGGGTQLYYGDYRYHHRHPWICRKLNESVSEMNMVDQEDRVSVKQRVASECGFTGCSILHRLHALYKFDILNDFVFDAMHTLLLGNVKRHLDHYKEQGYLSNPVVEERLAKMPWTAGI